ncbi:MAG: hypothetical protein QME42_10420, partial [bacterium]|nr:hypothetical protein [bacterium]
MFKRIALGLVLGLFWISPTFAKNPVLIVHGINGDSQSFKDGCLVTTLKNAGMQVFTLADLFGDFPNRGQGLIQEDVKLLKKAIDEVKRRTGATKVDIVAHSRGGLVSEFYTMMYGNQYQSSMSYEYYPAGVKREERFKKTETIDNIPKYGNDINQIIMMGAPQMGSFWSDFGHNNAQKLKWFRDHGIGKDAPDPASVGVEQLQEAGSNFMLDFCLFKALTSTVTYINLAEDRIIMLGGYGVVSIDSAKGSSLHQQQKQAKRLSDFGIPEEKHTNLYKSVGVKKQVLRELFDKSPIIAQITISRESPVREGVLIIDVTLSDEPPSPTLPKLFVKGNGAFSSPQQIDLAGSGKNFAGILNIPKDTDGNAKLYINDKVQIQVKIASEDCSQETTETIEIPITGEYSFLIDTEKPEVTNTAPANGAVIIAEEVPIPINISATLFDPPINGYASGIDPSTIILRTPQGTFKQASAVNNLDYGEYTC